MTRDIALQAETRIIATVDENGYLPMTAPSSEKRTRLLRLTPALQAELEWLAGEGSPNVARHARIVLGRASGLPIVAVAESIGVHPNTVRNCLRRFETLGIRGLAHASAGKPKNMAFTDAVREEIARLALRSPSSVGESFEHWSLRRLRQHLIARGIVRSISVEGLRQLLRGLPLPAASWRRTARPGIDLPEGVQKVLQTWATEPRAARRLRAQIVLASSQGLNELEIAAGLHTGRETVRRWLRRFRQSGILGLQSNRCAGVVPGRQARLAIERMARAEPRRFGVDMDRWTVGALRQAVLHQRIVRRLSERQLMTILQQAGIQVESGTASPELSSPAPQRHLG
jgi:transposase